MYTTFFTEEAAELAPGNWYRYCYSRNGDAVTKTVTLVDNIG